MKTVEELNKELNQAIEFERSLRKQKTLSSMRYSIGVNKTIHELSEKIKAQKNTKNQ